MLYSNERLEAKERTMDFGTIYRICMGQYGCERKLMSLTCPKDTTVNKGLNPELTVGTTKSGKPKIINRKADNTMYMMLSAEGRYIGRGNGTIKVLASQRDRFEVILRGNGADGDTWSGTGFWDCMLVKAPNTDAIVRVRTSDDETPSDLYVIHQNDVYHCTREELDDCCESLGIEIPCELFYDEDGTHFGNDWVTL